LADPHEPAEPGPPLPFRRRRWVRVGAGVLLLVPIVAGVWWQRAVTSDPKLEFPYFSRVNRVEHDATGDQEGIVQKRNVLGTEVEMTFRPGQHLYAYTGIRNDGRHTVRIERLPAAGYYYWGFDGMEVSPDRDAGIGQVTTYEPFKPFSLEPGEERSVRLNFRLADCDPAELQSGGSTTLGSMKMRYRILGVSRSVDVPFGKAALTVLAGGPCAHPIYDSLLRRS
jgi:hypothetical protein